MIALGESPAQTGSSLPGAAASPLFMLAFDHRRSIRSLFGIGGEPTPADAERIAATKLLILDGLLAARERLGSGTPALLVDEQYGAAVLNAAREHDLVAAVACERSGQAEFRLEYGDAFAAHVERFDPAFVKALVRFNPDGDAELNGRQLERLRGLGDWLASQGRALLFELLVPPEPDQLRNVGGDRERYDTELRPELVRRAVVAIQDAGIEPALWKIEGLEARSDCELIAAACRDAGRDRVGCLILGRGADPARVEHWLEVAAPVDGFSGFAVGRTIWWDAVAANLAGELDYEAAARAIGDRYLHFAAVYRSASRA